MPACLKRASSVFLDSPVKPGNDGVGDGDVVIIVRPLINQLDFSREETNINNFLTFKEATKIAGWPFIFTLEIKMDSRRCALGDNKK